jgi:hypothetical protein
MCLEDVHEICMELIKLAYHCPSWKWICRSRQALLESKEFVAELGYPCSVERRLDFYSLYNVVQLFDIIEHGGQPVHEAGNLFSRYRRSIA